MPLPAIGFGCSPYRRSRGIYADLEQPIEDALALGYRLLDSAELYGNEPQIGAILRRPGSPPRHALSIVSKVWNTNHAYDHVIAACEKTLCALGLSDLDLYLVHWPHAWPYRGPLDHILTLSREEIEALTFPKDWHGNTLTADVPLHETWRAMEALLSRGLVRAIGVSNFDVSQLAALLKTAQVSPAVNQIERHPYQTHEALVSWCEARDIQIMAYSPLSAPGLLHDPVLVALATHYGKTTAQVVLRWNLQRGVIPLPSSSQRERIAANLEVFDFALSAADMGAIDHLNRSGSQPEGSSLHAARYGCHDTEAKLHSDDDAGATDTTG